MAGDRRLRLASGGGNDWFEEEDRAGGAKRDDVVADTLTRLWALDGDGGFGEAGV